MKKAFWWILGILLSPVLLFVILTVLLYLPPVQNWAVDKVAAIASEKTGMDISVGHVKLAFPLDLQIDDFKMIQQPDTIADVERMIVDVQLLPLFDKQVVINELEVNNTKLNTSNFVEAALVKGSFKRLYVSSKGIDLDKQTVKVNGARLEDAILDVQLNDSVPEDTTTSVTLWKINIDSVVVSRSDLTLHMPGDTMSVKAHMGTLTAREALIDLGTETYTVGSVDLVSGEVKSEYASDVMTSSYLSGLNTDYIGYEASTAYFGNHPSVWVRNWNYQRAAARKAGGIGCTCNYFPASMNNTTIFSSQYRIYFDVDGKNITSVQDFINYVANIEQGGNSLKIAFELATPTESSIEPQEIYPNEGVNNIWNDANGITEVGYFGE